MPGDNPNLATPLRFAATGAVGFAVDSGLSLLISEFFVIELARIPAFLLASLATFTLHRLWTFGPGDSSASVAYRKYLLASLAGAALNYMIFLAVLWAVGRSPIEVLMAIGAGAAGAMGFNYYMSAYYVFRSSTAKAPSKAAK